MLGKAVPSSLLTICSGESPTKKVWGRGKNMDEGESSPDLSREALDLDIRALLGCVAAAIGEIEQAKQERSTQQMRAARTHLAALHGVARLRRHIESDAKVA
jgi:hypothetical protein